MRRSVLWLLCRLQCKQHGCKVDRRMVKIMIVVESMACSEWMRDMRMKEI